MKISRYNKTVASVVVQALAWWDFVLNSKPQAITAQEYHLGAFMLAVSLGVYAIANEPQPPTNTTQESSNGSRSTDNSHREPDPGAGTPIPA